MAGCGRRVLGTSRGNNGNISQLYVWHGLAVLAKLEPHREPLGQTFPSYDCMAGRILRRGTSIFHTRDGRGVSSCKDSGENAAVYFHSCQKGSHKFQLHMLFMSVYEVK